MIAAARSAIIDPMRILPALALSVMLASPLAAEEPAPPAGDDLSRGADLMGEAARLLFRGLMAEMEPGLNELGAQLRAMEPALRELATMIGDAQNYHAPERLPNGDIILRRKVPLLPPALQSPGAEVDL